MGMDEQADEFSFLPSDIPGQKAPSLTRKQPGSCRDSGWTFRPGSIARAERKSSSAVPAFVPIIKRTARSGCFKTVLKFHMRFRGSGKEKIHNINALKSDT
ncbi:MAG: hypothetical protein K9K64_16290 [Desulfohalobiaceae bacterium]|nr:hypothetical protein [Desulfohalobiaceae bacterium]